jgi:hypothetical protein
MLVRIDNTVTVPGVAQQTTAALNGSRYVRAPLTAKQQVAPFSFGCGLCLAFSSLGSSDQPSLPTSAWCAVRCARQ